MHPDASTPRIAVLGAAAIIGGLLVGFVGGAFRWCLQTAEALRSDLVTWAQQLPGPGWLIPMAVVAACATITALIVRWEPTAIGSGIPDVRRCSSVGRRRRGGAADQAARRPSPHDAGGVERLLSFLCSASGPDRSPRAAPGPVPDGPVCYSAAVPGGLFARLLAVGTRPIYDDLREQVRPVQFSSGI